MHPCITTVPGGRGLINQKTWENSQCSEYCRKCEYRTIWRWLFARVMDRCRTRAFRQQRNLSWSVSQLEGCVWQHCSSVITYWVLLIWCYKLFHDAVYRLICSGITRSCSGHLASISSRVKRNYIWRTVQFDFSLGRKELVIITLQLCLLPPMLCRQYI